MKLENKARAFIKENSLFSKSHPLLIGVSGGVDSVALLHFLVKEGYQCSIAHMNFSLRGKESDEETLLVKNLADKYKVPVYSRRVETEAYARDFKLSIEMAARDLRYNFFYELLKEHHIRYVAVAHHNNDVVETFLMNTARGTGLRGLSGIPIKNNRVVRPFLSVSRNEILEYARKEKLPFKTDSSNFDTRIRRNYFRHEIIPAFEEVNPAFTKAIQNTTKYINHAQEFISRSVAAFELQHITKKNNRVNIPIIALKQSGAPALFLFEILHPYGFNSTQVDEMLSSEERSGKVWLGNNYRLIKDREDFIVTELPVEVEDLSFFIDEGDNLINTPISINFETISDFDIHKVSFNKNKAIFDASKITYPLQLRRWRKGDWFIPFGMEGRKKLSDYFIDRKISLDEKLDFWLLISGIDIIWIVGERTDNRYRVEEGVKRVLEVTLEV